MRTTTRSFIPPWLVKPKSWRLEPLLLPDVHPDDLR
jgi:hypothetical protein